MSCLKFVKMIILLIFLVQPPVVILAVLQQWRMNPFGTFLCVYDVSSVVVALATYIVVTERCNDGRGARSLRHVLARVGLRLRRRRWVHKIEQ